MLSGVSSWYTYREKGYRGIDYQVKKVLSLFVEYAFATAIYLIIGTHRFDLKTFLIYLLGFNISGPFYYFLFFFQLQIITPILIVWCKYCGNKKHRWIYHVISIGVLCMLAALSINYTYVLPVHGGGQYLFGGTYVVCLYLGMVFACEKMFPQKQVYRLFVLCLALCLWIVWWRELSNNSLPFDRRIEKFWGAGFNPPSFNFIFFAIITMYLCYALFSLMERWRVSMFIVKALAILGKNTLYVFMYHILIQGIIIRQFSDMAKRNIWLYRFFMYSSMLLIPVVVGIIFKKTTQKIKMFYKAEVQEFNRELKC